MRVCAMSLLLKTEHVAGCQNPMQDLGYNRRIPRTQTARHVLVAASRRTDITWATYPEVLTAPTKSGASISGSTWDSLDEVDLEETVGAPAKHAAEQPSQQVLEQPMYYIRAQHPSAQQVVGGGTGGFRYFDGRVKQGFYTSGSNPEIEPPNKSMYGFMGVLIGVIAYVAEIAIEII